MRCTKPVKLWITTLPAFLIAIFTIFFSGFAAVDDFFEESFVWKGGHAAVIKEGTATTVWWDAHKWDVRADTVHNAIAYVKGSKGHHIDTHSAAD